MVIITHGFQIRAAERFASCAITGSIIKFTKEEFKMDKINKLPLHTRILLSVTIVLIPVSIILLQLNKFMGLIQATLIDFMAYWTFARIFLTGGNPYDPSQLFLLQKSMESRLELPIIAWYPPWSLPLISIAGFRDYILSHIAWIIITIILLLGCISITIKIYQGEREQTILAALGIVTFCPAVFSIYEGQINILMAFGLVSFIYFLQKKKYLLSGILLSLCTIKPQLLICFWLVLLFWTIKHRKWQVLLGLFISITVLTIVSVIVDPQIIKQYLNLLQTSPPQNISNMSIHVLITKITAQETAAVQYILLFIGILASLLYWWKHREDWDWLHDGFVIIFISLITSPYVWLHDLVLLIPPLIACTLIVMKWDHKITRIIAIAGYIVIDIAMFLVTYYDPNRQYLYSWLLILLFSGYLLIRRRRNPDTVYPTAVNAAV